MHLKSLFVLSLSILFLLTSFSCKYNIIDNDNDPSPGPRNYTWTIDSLHNYADENMFYLISGSSPEDVWLTGSGLASESILHYDGKKIEIVRANPIVEGKGIFTLSPQSTWLGSSRGEFFKFNGQSLNFINSISINDTGKVNIRDIWGTSESDLWACGHNWTDNNGQYGVIMKYNGSRWDTVHVENNPMTQFVKIRKGNNTENKIYLISYSVDRGRDSVHLYEYDNHSLKTLHSAWVYTNGDEFPFFFSVRNNLYFCFNSKIHTYSDNRFNVVKDLSGFNTFGGSFYGRSFNDIFVTYENGIGHYNGNNLEMLFKFPFTGWASDALIFENDVFFVCYKQGTEMKSYLIHGRLNKN